MGFFSLNCTEIFLFLIFSFSFFLYLLQKCLSYFIFERLLTIREKNPVTRKILTDQRRHKTLFSHVLFSTTPSSSTLHADSNCDTFFSTTTIPTGKSSFLIGRTAREIELSVKVLCEGGIPLRTAKLICCGL